MHGQDVAYKGWRLVITSAEFNWAHMTEVARMQQPVSEHPERHTEPQYYQTGSHRAR